MHKRLFVLLSLFVVLQNSSFGSNISDSLNLQLQSEISGKSSDELNVLAEEYLQIDAYFSIEYAQASIDISRRNRNKLNQAIAYRLQGSAYLTIGYNNLALQNYQTSLKLCKELNNKEEQAKVLNKIGIVYKRTNNTKLALTTFNDCLEMQIELNNTKEIASLYINMGAVYSMEYNHDSALYYAQKANMTYDFYAENEISLFALYNNNLGYVYECFYMLDSALKYYNIAIDVADEIDEYGYLSSYYVNIAYVYFELGKYSLSDEYFQKSLEITKENNFKSTQAEAYIGLYQLNIKTKNYFNATTYLEEYMTVLDSINIVSNNVKIEELRLTYDIGEKEKEIQILERDKQIIKIKQDFMVWAVIVISIIGLLVVVILFSRFRSQRKVLKLDVDKRKLKSKLLKDEISYKNSQLTDFALHIIQRNEFLREINSQVKELRKNANPEVLKEIKNIESTIKHSINQTNDRKEFNAKVEIANQMFYKILAEKYPDLTKNEKKVAALIKLGLSSKEISTLLSVNAKSVDNYRYHIRKKLHLTRDGNLYDHLNSIF